MLCAAKFLLQYSRKPPIQNNPSSPLIPSYLLLGILQSIALMKHRKLFPTPKDNNTDPCLGVCDPTCPYGCDPYADIYSIPPPRQSSDRKSHHISPFVIVIVTLLASCFLLVGCYFIVARYFPGYNCFRRRRRQPEATDEEFLDENRGPPIDHPIWYINTIGLQPSVIDSITIFRYKRGDNLVEGTECSVCLNEFQNDETLRLLPKCSHAFHISCIDTWLRSHTNCPVCRAGIVCNSVNTPVASTGLNSHSMRLDEDSDVENLENDEELNVSQSRAGEFCENRTDTGEIRELSQVHHDAKLSVVSKSNSVSSVIDGLNDTFMIEEGNYERQLMRRSVSVDSLLAANIGEAIHNLSLAECEDISVDQTIEVDHVSGKNIGGKSRTSRIIDGDSSITQFLHKKPVRMKRSFSYAGRSYLSRQNSRNNSLLLPL